MCEWGSYKLRSPRVKCIYIHMTLRLKKHTQNSLLETVSSIVAVVGRDALGLESLIISMVT